MSTRRTYEIEKIYLVHCDACNAEITRSENGEDCHTMEEARNARDDHEAGHVRDEVMFGVTP